MSAPSGVEALTPAPVPAGGPARRRAWLLTGLVALVVLAYLVSWSVYADVHTRDRFRVLEPGASASRSGADVRLLGLREDVALTASDGGDPSVAVPGATWVSAELELTQRQPGDVNCLVGLLGPDDRLWESQYPGVERPLPGCRSDEVRVGVPYRFEATFQVPQDLAGQVVGVALVDRSTAARIQVLRPPG